MIFKMSAWNKLKKILSEELNKKDFETWILPLRYIGEDDKEIYLKAPNKDFYKIFKTTFFKNVQEIASVNGGFVLNIFVPGYQKPEVSDFLKPTKIRKEKPRLNPNYRFDNFVVLESNQFAAAISKAVAENPSSAYNPVYIYGGAGLGKTHLLNAIGNYIVSASPDVSVVYKTSSDFLNEMVTYLKNQKPLEFRRKYIDIDVLIIDDIQYIQTWESTRKEIFFIFNDRYEHNKQIVISSDCPPKEIPNLEDRLRSRFEWGVIAKIDPPDLEGRIAILLKKGEEKGVELPSQVAEIIASSVKDNVRTMEGVLTKLIALSNIRGEKITSDLAKEVLKDYVSFHESNLTPERIKKVVSEIFKVKLHLLSSKNNSPDIVIPRQVAMYLMREMLEMPMNSIGKEFGNKHHSTVIHSIKKVEERIEEDMEFKEKLKEIKRRLES